MGILSSHGGTEVRFFLTPLETFFSFSPEMIERGGRSKLVLRLEAMLTLGRLVFVFTGRFDTLPKIQT